MQVFTDLQQLPSFNNTVLTIGSFDGVHAGHRQILNQVQALARERGAESVVLTFEPHPRVVLQPDDETFKLITLSKEKILLMEECGIDNVVLAPFTPDFAQLSAQEYVEGFIMKYFKPQIIVIGYDHRFGANREGNIDFLQKYAGKEHFSILEIPAQQVDAIAVSSTKIRKALESARISHANRLLGYPYFLSGKVIEGNRIGRKLGFPTANIQIAEKYKLVPPEGIYAARVYAGDIHEAMLYIGNRPSIAGANGKSIEVNLLHFSGDLYGKEIVVEVLEFIRPDKKLSDLDALKQQIEADQVAITDYFSAGNVPPPRLRNTADFQKNEPEPETPASAAGTSVSIVILNYNTREHLERFLPAVVQHSGQAEIVVADNGSPDDSIAFVRKQYPAIKVLDLRENYGFARGYNVALDQVKSDYYIILNSDVEVTPGWLEPILEEMRNNPAIAVAQPKILAWYDKKRFEYAGAAGGWIDYLGYPFCRGRIFSRNEEDLGQYDSPQECFWASGAAFFIRAELYHKFGGFDGDYFAHNEEIDLCWRLKRAGYQVWCFPQSVVYHLGGGTLEYENPRKVFLNFRNSLFSLLKNEPVGKLLWLLPARLVLDGLAALRFALKGQFRAIRAIAAAHFSFYKNFRHTLRKRRAAAEVVDKQRIGLLNKAGIYPGSIVFAHYARRVKRFSQLPND
ncbi:MAG: bifunctional riboflavin kinase/FAD synthetase [Lewinellaceae bacterium]|nr:bifunctional riboflavin kinase/FAD synthetase [Saprospiraceae bacterium]MCB9329512.1 bifunctional riboflavin kinase/FAD synthetase [Lewinellaceae bacterium]